MKKTIFYFSPPEIFVCVEYQQ